MNKAQTSVADKQTIESINLKSEEPTDVKFQIIRNNGYEWNVKASEFAKKTTNPIRAIVEHLNVQPNPEKSFIPLSVGKSYKWNRITYIYIPHHQRSDHLLDSK